MTDAQFGNLIDIIQGIGMLVLLWMVLSLARHR